MGPLLFLMYVNDIWRNIASNIRLFAGDCIIYKKITNKNHIANLQKVLDTFGEGEVENGMNINPDKSKTIRFTRSRVKIYWVTPLLTKKFRKGAVVNILE